MSGVLVCLDLRLILDVCVQELITVGKRKGQRSKEEGAP
jgi:hypothetical protein